jgi:hypothetical protein
MVMDTSARPEDHVITSEEEFDRLPQTVKMRQDLQDPARRVALREEYQKQELPRLHPDLREELQLTADQEGRLFALLADFQLQYLDLFYTKESDHLTKHKRIQENEQRRDEALQSLLGADTLQKYRRYQLELWERQFVARLVLWLNPANALSPEQKSQLMTVLKSQREEARRQSEQERRDRLRSALRTNNSAASLLEANIRSHENQLKQLEAQSFQLLQHAASFLSTSQLGTLTRMENQKLEAQRRLLDSLRAQRASASSAAQAGTGFAAFQAERLPDLPDDPEAPS